MKHQNQELASIADELRYEVEALTVETAAEWIDQQLDITVSVDLSAKGELRHLRSVQALCGYGGPTVTVTWNGCGEYLDIEVTYGRYSARCSAVSVELAEQFRLIGEVALDHD